MTATSNEDLQAHLDPTGESVQLLLKRNLTGPIVMLNLLRLRATADYRQHPDLTPAEPISGSEAFRRYVRHTEPFLKSSGGRILFIGQGGNYFIGPATERWDVMMLVEQSSLADFFAFADDAAYLAGIGHRVAAAEDSRLLPLVRDSPQAPTADGSEALGARRGASDVPARPGLTQDLEA